MSCAAASADLATQFNVPVREINEMLPGVLRGQADLHMHEGPPPWPSWPADESQARLVRSAIGLARVASDTRTHNVLPGSRPTAVAGDHVVKVQVLPIEYSATVL